MTDAELDEIAKEIFYQHVEAPDGKGMTMREIAGVLQREAEYHDVLELIGWGHVNGMHSGNQILGHDAFEWAAKRLGKEWP